MKHLKTTISYRVPNWSYCNLEQGGGILTETCRFCTIIKKGRIQVSVCSLHNEPLKVSDGFVTLKCQDCLKQIGTVTEDSSVEIPPKDLIKWTITEYEKNLTELTKCGYPIELARKYAKLALIGKD